LQNILSAFHIDNIEDDSSMMTLQLYRDVAKSLFYRRI